MTPTPDIRDIKDLVAVPGLPWWAWLLIALAVVGSAALVYWWSQRPRRAMAVPPSPPPPPPAATARRALQALLDEGLIERGEVDRFYTRLSDIVRQYLEGQFRLRAPERTTEEFLQEITHEPRLSAPQRSLLGEFLQESDLVKFARHQPGADDMRRGHAAATRLVEETAG